MKSVEADGKAGATVWNGAGEPGEGGRGIVGSENRKEVVLGSLRAESVMPQR